MDATQPQQSTWDAVDRALEQWLAPQDDALRAAPWRARHQRSAAGDRPA